jgi:hypothetical protein
MITPDLLKTMSENTDEDSHGTTALTMLNLLKELGVDKATFTYNGSGDSPDSCDGQFWSLKSIVVTTDPETKEQTSVEDWEEIDHKHPKFELIKPYYDSFSEFTFNLSYARWGGWYNNEGGFGTGTYMARGDNPCVTIDHYSYIQSEVFEGEFEYGAAGDKETKPAHSEDDQA